MSDGEAPKDYYIGDDFHHNGAFRLSYGFEYAYLVENDKELSQFPFDPFDTYEWYLQLVLPELSDGIIKCGYFVAKQGARRDNSGTM